MLQGRTHDHISEGGHPDLLLMVIGSPQGVTLQLTQYRRLHKKTMGTEDEHRGIPIEYREVSEDLGEGTHPRGLLPAACKHHPTSHVWDVGVLVSIGIVQGVSQAVCIGKENHPWETQETIIKSM